MTAAEINEQWARERIAHHYFYQAGSTMVRFPLFRFNPEFYPENAAKLERVVEAEKAAGRFMNWCGNGCANGHAPTPEPFPEYVDRFLGKT